MISSDSTILFYQLHTSLWIMVDSEGNNIRSSRPEVFCKKGVLGNFAKLTGTGKHLCHLCLRPATLLKKRLWQGVFLWILRNFYEHLSYRIPLGDCSCNISYVLKLLNPIIKQKSKRKPWGIVNRKEMVKKLYNSLLTYLIVSNFLNNFTLMVYKNFEPVTHIRKSISY